MARAWIKRHTTCLHYNNNTSSAWAPYIPHAWPRWRRGGVDVAASPCLSRTL